MKRHLFLCATLFAPFPHGVAGGAGPMWVFPVARLCVAQDPRYTDSVLGQMILQSSLKLPSDQFGQCARSKQWIPDAVCAELMALASDQELSRSNLERLGSTFSADLKILRVAGPYVMAAEEAGNAGKALPPCP